MDKTSKIDKFLKELQELSKETRLSPDRIYTILSYYSIPYDEQNISIENYFDRFINNFRNVPNANVFVDTNWSYFCQFTNDPTGSMYDTNPIKIYVPLRKEYLEENVNKIIMFMAKNNIVHRSKLAKKVRADDLVLRVRDKNDADKVINYINSTIPKEDLYECNPFCISEGSVGLAMDRYMSYNEILSKYLCLYISSIYYKNEVASYESFKNFMQANLRALISKQAKNYILRFKSPEDYHLSNEEFLANVNEITTLIVRNLELANKEYMYQLHNELNKDGYFDEEAAYYSPYNRDNYINYNASVNEKSTPITNTNEDRNLLIEIIRITSEKYGIEKTKDLLNNYREEQYISAITRKDNLRDRVASSSTFYNYITNLSTDELNEMIDKYSEQKETEYSEQSLLEDNENNERLLIAIAETMVKKYGLEKAFYYINAYRESFNVNCITRDNDLRNKVATSKTFHVYMASMSKEDLLEFLKSHSKNNEQVASEANDKENEKEMILEETCKLTYTSAVEKNYDGKKQVLSALIQASAGDYNYFTRTSNARETVQNNISPLEIEKLAKKTLEKKGYMIKQRRDIYLFYPTYIEYLCEEQRKSKVK